MLSFYFLLCWAQGQAQVSSPIYITTRPNSGPSIPGLSTSACGPAETKFVLPTYRTPRPSTGFPFLHGFLIVATFRAAQTPGHPLLPLLLPPPCMASLRDPFLSPPLSFSMFVMGLFIHGSQIIFLFLSPSLSLSEFSLRPLIWERSAKARKKKVGLQRMLNYHHRTENRKLLLQDIK